VADPGFLERGRGGVAKATTGRVWGGGVPSRLGWGLGKAVPLHRKILKFSF